VFSLNESFSLMAKRTPTDPWDIAFEFTTEDLLETLRGTQVRPTTKMVMDMSSRYPDDPDVLRVELRPCRITALEETDPDRRGVEERYVIGLLPTSELPQEGEPFEIFYHNFMGFQSFGTVESIEPIHTVTRVDDYFFFTAGDVNWRLKILDQGN